MWLIPIFVWWLSRVSNVQLGSPCMEDLVAFGFPLEAYNH